MNIKELLETISLHYEGCTNENCENLNNQILNYTILVKELKSDFKYKYTELTIDKVDFELETITLKKEN